MSSRLVAPSCRLVENAVGLVAYFTQVVHYAHGSAAAVSCTTTLVQFYSDKRIVQSRHIFGPKVAQFLNLMFQIPLAGVYLCNWASCSTLKF